MTDLLDRPTPTEHAPSAARGGAPPTVAEALLRRWWLILVCAAVAAGAGAFVAEGRTPEWTSSSRLGIGRVALDAQSVPGYAEGSSALAGAYSRLATSQPVMVAAARELRSTPDDVVSRTTGTQIANSPTLRIETRAGDPRTAAATANAVTEALRTYLLRINTTSQTPLLDRVQSAQRSLAAAQLAERRAVRRQQQAASSEEVRRARQSAVLDARAAARAAEVRAEAASQRYRDVVATGDPEELLQVLNPASQATSDAGAARQKLVLSGAVGGGFVGSVLALLLARRRRRGSPPS